MLSALIFLFTVSLCAANPTPEVDLRIVGGYTAHEKQFPFAAALFLDEGTDNSNFCGGSLISADYILTAAHCAAGFSQVTVVLGSNVINDTTPEQVIVNSTQFIVPDEYVANTNEFDVALIKLPEPVEFNDYLQPISLAEGNDTFAGDLATVVGWGIQWGAQTTAEPLLRYVENVVLSNRQCVKNDPTYKLIVKETNICQSTLADRGACHGDSGGPLAIDGVQIGIVSVGYANCFMEKPVVFTRITSVRDWIRENSGV